jgi:IclR family mhp operon transcriptional activator
MLEVTASLVPEDAALAKDRSYIQRIVSQTKELGYASSVGQVEHGISGIALPIEGPRPVLGSLNIVFFSSAMTPEVAAKRYLRSMKNAVNDIERRWAAGSDKRPIRRRTPG